MKNRKYDWFPVIILSLLIQYMTQHLLLFIDSSVNQSITWVLIVKINFFIIALVGGIVAKHFYIKHSHHIGGICATLYIILSQIYIGHTTLTVNGCFILILAYLTGYGGCLLYTNYLHKRFR
ncbi:MAG: hypothetical protein R3267_12140 [Paenisporosarcina sp.]|nr:hypothetical protein [Paenisporosarcina sp.]